VRRPYQPVLWPITWMLIAAFILTVLPLPLALQWWQPPWVLFVLLSWTIRTPEQFPVSLAWFAGLVLDLYTGTVLGMHALIYVLAVFTIKRYHHRWQSQPNWVRLIGAYALFLGAYLLQYAIMRWASPAPPVLSFWFSLVSACVLWPFVFVVLRMIQRR